MLGSPVPRLQKTPDQDQKTSDLQSWSFVFELLRPQKHRNTAESEPVSFLKTAIFKSFKFTPKNKLIQINCKTLLKIIDAPQYFHKPTKYEHKLMFLGSF